MTTVWRNSAWVLLGSALILALSLGVRHGFGFVSAAHERAVWLGA